MEIEKKNKVKIHRSRKKRDESRSLKDNNAFLIDLLYNHYNNT